MILFKLLIKLYSTVLLLSTRTRCLCYQSSENKYEYLPYRMYSKLLIKLYATELLLSTRTRCLCYQSSENEYEYLPYRMYSSTSLQSLIYKILFLGGTNFTEVISSTNTLSISIITSTTLSMGIIVWDDAFINSSSTVNYYKYRFVD